MTQKLSWNKENRFPHSTFWWEGIDGSRVLTHFPPVETYNAMIVPAEQADLVRNFHEHGWSDWSLTPYGYGNGGGGPTREMVERARRMADIDGLPRLELGTVDGFFEAVEAEAASRRAGAGVVGRAVLRDAPRHAHESGPDEGGQPAQRAAPARGRVVVDDARLAGRGGVRAGRALEGPAGPAVPRHPAGLVHRLGPCRCGGRAREDHRSPGDAGRRGARLSGARSARRGVRAQPIANRGGGGAGGAVRCRPGPAAVRRRSRWRQRQWSHGLPRAAYRRWASFP